MIKKTFNRKISQEKLISSSKQEDLESPPDDSEERANQKAYYQDKEFFSPSYSKSWLQDPKGVLIGMGMGIILTLVAGRFLFNEQPSNSSSAPSETVTETQPPAKSITLASAKLDSVQRTLKATGSVAAVEPIDLFAQASNLQIRQVLADEGDYVEAGQTLVLLDDSRQQAQLMQYQAKVAEAEARLAELRAGSRTEDIAQAKARIQRIKAELEQVKADWELAKMRVQRNAKLQEEGAIALDLLDGLKTTERTKQALVFQTQASLSEAQQELRELENGPRPEVIAQAVAQLADAKAQYQMALSEVRDTKVISPVSGQISQRDARVGNVTTPNQKLFTIIENGQLELRLKVPETQLPAIRPGQTVSITSDADKTLKLTGKVREIEPRVDENSRQGIVRVDLPTATNLKPGMFLRGAVVTNNATSLTIPMQAVLPQPDGSGKVFVLQPDETVKATTVTLGEILSQGRIEILDGLKPSDRIAVKGVAYLNDGDRVSVSSLTVTSDQ